METELLLERIKRNFSKIEWVTFRHIVHGWDHDVVILDNNYVVRFPKNKAGQKKILKEVTLLRALKKKMNGKIPEPVFVHPTGNFVGYKLIRGKECRPWIYKKMNESQKNKFTKDIAHFLKELHSTPASIIRKNHVQIEDTKAQFKKLELDCRRFIYPKLTNKDIYTIKSFLNKLEVSLWKIAIKTLNHGDLTWEHIFIDKKTLKLTGIIDFSDASYGDYAVDFAGLWDYGPKFVKGVCEFYKDVDSFLLERSKLYHKRVALIIMVESQRSKHCSFKSGYNLFHQRF